MPAALPTRPRPAALALFALAAALLPALAPAPAAAQADVDVVADELAQTGSYVTQEVGDDVRAAIDEANEQGIGVVLLADDTDAVELARGVSAELDERGSGPRIVLAVSRSSAGAASETVEGLGPLLAGGSPAFEALARGATAEGIRTFTAGVVGDGAAAGDVGGDGPIAGDREGSGGGFPWVALLVVLALLGAGFVGFRLWQGRRERQEEAAEVEADKAEIREQLRDNADAVISLGDRVIASGDAELVSLYERASSTYRDVSQSVDGAASPEAVDRLDDRLDEAEWQLRVIEARLEGRPPPPPPSPEPPDGPPPPPSASTPPAPGPPVGSARSDDRPALGPDESLFAGPHGSAPPPPPMRRGRSTGGFGGLGGLGGILLGGGGHHRSRRTTRRRGTSSSRRSAGPARRRGSSGGGSFRRRGSSGGGSFGR